MGDFREFMLATGILVVGIVLATLAVTQIDLLRSLPAVVRVVAALVGGGAFFLVCLLVYGIALRRTGRRRK